MEQLQKEEVVKCKKYNYGIELLRIVSMFMIIGLHLMGHGGLLKTTIVGSDNYKTAWVIETLFYVSVNTFALISGFVGYKSNNGFSKFINIWFQVIFFSVSIHIFSLIVEQKQFNFLELILIFIPVTSGKYWYVSAYFMVLVFMPLLNFIITKIDKKQLRTFIWLFILLFCIMPQIVKFLSLNGFKITINDHYNLDNGYSGLWLMFLYIVGGFVSKHGFSSLFGNISSFVISGICFIFQLIIALNNPMRAYLSYTNVFILMQAVSMLDMFSKIQINSDFSCKFILLISKSMFSVYLIHENPYIRDTYIVNSTIKYAGLSTEIMLLHYFKSLIIVLLICLVIDFIRRMIFHFCRINKFAKVVGGFVDCEIFKIIPQNIKKDR